MRTTIDINDQLLREAKEAAARQGRPLRALVEDSLRAMLHGQRRRSGGYRLTWSTDHGRVQPGVRLDDRESLFEAMEER